MRVIPSRQALRVRLPTRGAEAALFPLIKKSLGAVSIPHPMWQSNVHRTVSVQGLVLLSHSRRHSAPDAGGVVSQNIGVLCENETREREEEGGWVRASERANRGLWTDARKKREDAAK